MTARHGALMVVAVQILAATLACLYLVARALDAECWRCGG